MLETSAGMTNTNRLPVEIDYADSTMQELRFIIPHTGSAPKLQTKF